MTIRGIYHRDPPQNALYFDAKYLEEAVPWFKGQAGWYAAQIDAADHVAEASRTIDEMSHNAPLQTKTESEKAFQLGFVASLGNVKAFILSICGAVVFAIMLVSANTMAMSVRSRTREVAVLEDARLHPAEGCCRFCECRPWPWLSRADSLELESQFR